MNPCSSTWKSQVQPAERQERRQKNIFCLCLTFCRHCRNAGVFPSVSAEGTQLDRWHTSCRLLTFFTAVLLMSHCTPLTDSCLWFGRTFSLLLFCAFWFWVWALFSGSWSGFLVCFIFRPFLLWIIRRTSFLILDILSQLRCCFCFRFFVLGLGPCLLVLVFLSRLLFFGHS